MIYTKQTAVRRKTNGGTFGDHHLETLRKTLIHAADYLPAPLFTETRFQYPNSTG
jgi:hypothetical protein